MRATETSLDRAFDRDSFLLRQKHLAVKEKYYVWDTEGSVLMYIERPRHVFRNMMALFAGFFAFLVAWVVIFAVGNVATMPFVPRSAEDGVFEVWALVGLLGAIVVGVQVAYGLSAKRNLTVYRDDTRKEALLAVSQEKKFQPLVETYAVETPEGNHLATLRRPRVRALFRRLWYCLDIDGLSICNAVEDSAVKAVLRRLLGPLFGILRTNFVIYDPATDAQLGEFNRCFTLLDRYVLDLSRDSDRRLDRRVALALGVMLDTGERR